MDTISPENKKKRGRPRKDILAVDTLVTPGKDNPNELLNNFLKKNNLKLTISALDNENPFVGNGFLLTDKPLLKIGVEYLK